MSNTTTVSGFKLDKPLTLRRSIDILVSSDGGAPFIDWLRSQNDAALRAAVLNSINALSRGIFVGSISLGSGLFEVSLGEKLKSSIKSKMYFAVCGNEGILIVSAGEIEERTKNLETARKLLQEFKNNAH
jgi:putative component of toxin-antitoxin plasmid stabilization module